MPKSKKKKKSPPAVSDKPAALVPDDKAPATEKKPKERLMVRAIRVTPALLEAAKAYKKASGKSFYALGLEAITERLVREGFPPESKS